jgi:CRP/FNR family cyclic AMP-dependent transcriptional regulator
MTSTQTIERALGALPMLSGLNPRQRARLAARATTHIYPAGSVIVRQGDTSMALYVVLSGAARVERDNEGGDPIPLGELQPGGMFGEMGLVDDVTRSATVVALQRTECILLAKWDFEKAFRQDAQVGLALLRDLTARVRTLESRLVGRSPA